MSNPEGAAIQGASITLKNMGTAASRTTISDNTGSYQFPQVSPGTYRISAEMPGFKTIVRENLELMVNTPTRLNLAFAETGSTIEVDVLASPLPWINTVDATVGNTIENSQIVALPLEARSVAGLLSLQPGVSYTGIEDKVHPDTRGGAVAGARSDQTNVTLDGVDVNDQQTGEAFKSVLPVTLDSVQEFRFVISNAGADFGRSSGGQVSIVTRSGTNVFHGSAYEYNRNTATSANSFFNNSTINTLTGKTLERPKLIRNVFGAALGGPIKRNRLFFFVNFEDTITRREEPELRIVPSSTLRQGILRYVDTSGAVQTVMPQQLRSMDPLQLGPNPAVLALLQQYPVGNDPTQGGDGALNFIGFRFNAPLSEDKPSYIARVDYASPNRKHAVFLRGALADWKEDDLAAQFPGQRASRTLLTNSKGFVVGHTWSISPKLVSQFHWGFTRQGLDFTGGSTSPGLDLRGIDNIQNFIDRNNGRKVPVHNFVEDLVWINGRHTLQIGVNFRSIHNERFTEEHTYPFYRSNQGWLKDPSSVLPPQIAADFRTPYIFAQMALLGTINQAEVTYFVDRDGTIFPVPHTPRREFINKEFEWYVQDQWKLARSVVLSAGLRYSYFAPPYESNGFQVRPALDIDAWFAKRRDGAVLGIPSSANPLLSFALAGKANNGQPFFGPDKNNFAPRLALAWSPSFSGGLLHGLFGNPGQASIRLGIGLFYDRTGGSFPVTADLGGSVGLSTYVVTRPTAYGYDTAPRFSGLQNLSAIPLPPPPTVGFPTSLGIGAGSSGFAVDSRLRTPYSTTFNFSISRGLPGNLTVEAAYVGRIGKKLLALTDFGSPLVNFRDPKSGQSWIDASGIIADLIDRNTPLTQIPRIPFLENIFAPLATAEMSASQAFYKTMLANSPSPLDGLYALDTASGGSTIFGPYTFFQQQFNSLTVWTNLGQSSYHSAQFIVRKRLGNSLQADFNYTLAKTLDNASSVESEGQSAFLLLNAFDHRQNLSFSNFDIRHQINSNFVLDVPVGRGRRFGVSMNRVLQGIVGDWRLTGLLRWRTGFPFPTFSGNGFSFPTNYNANGPPTLKPGVPLPEVKLTKNAEGGPNIFPDPGAAYDEFQYTRSGFSGSRNLLHGPGFFSLDSGVQKNFIIPEHGEIQFRWETLNVTNTVNFDGRVNPLGNNGIDFDLDRKSSFGRLRSLAGSPRIMQFALRYQF